MTSYATVYLEIGLDRDAIDNYKGIQSIGCLNLFYSICIKYANGKYEKFALQSGGGGARIRPDGNRNNIALMWTRSWRCMESISFD